jgi:hypothetical protein
MLVEFDCHINVEICTSIKAIAYINKYIFKGGDRTTLHVKGGMSTDEVSEYLEARYICPVEACCHLLELAMHGALPAVYRLPVHLPDQQLVYFNPDDDLDDILERGSSKKTALTEFFVANANANPLYAEARQITYQEFPQKFTWDKSAKKWSPRKNKLFALGRMYFASPAAEVLPTHSAHCCHRSHII